ncbi:MAG: prepilin-type N-terminal cleavage/methylation domain-containing protein [Rickettsiales bacterium]
MTPQARATQGFSLVELAIVMVIVGLLAAGVTAGRTLMASAQMRVIIAEAQNFKLQTDNFFSRYDALPGDLKNANDAWTNAESGNGNGKIEDDESFQFWKQLRLAELIAGNFSGEGPDAAIGVNVPASKENAAGFDALRHEAPGGWVDKAGRHLKGNYLRYGKEPTPTGDADYLTAPALTGESAADIDAKIDNGVPNYGGVLAVNGEGATHCYNADGSAYDYSVKLPQCVLLFTLGY